MLLSLALGLGAKERVMNKSSEAGSDIEWIDIVLTKNVICQMDLKDTNSYRKEYPSG